MYRNVPRATVIRMVHSGYAWFGKKVIAATIERAKARQDLAAQKPTVWDCEVIMRVCGKTCDSRTDRIYDSDGFLNLAGLRLSMPRRYSKNSLPPPVLYGTNRMFATKFSFSAIKNGWLWGLEGGRQVDSETRIAKRTMRSTPVFFSRP